MEVFHIIFSFRFGKTLIIQDVDQVEPILFPLLRGDLISQGQYVCLHYFISDVLLYHVCIYLVVVYMVWATFVWSRLRIIHLCVYVCFHIRLYPCIPTFVNHQIQ